MADILCEYINYHEDNEGLAWDTYKYSNIFQLTHLVALMQQDSPAPTSSVDDPLRNAIVQVERPTFDSRKYSNRDRRGGLRLGFTGRSMVGLP